MEDEEEPASAAAAAPAAAAVPSALAAVALAAAEALPPRERLRVRLRLLPHEEEGGEPAAANAAEVLEDGPELRVRPGAPARALAAQACGWLGAPVQVTDAQLAAVNAARARLYERERKQRQAEAEDAETEPQKAAALVTRAKDIEAVWRVRNKHRSLLVAVGQALASRQSLENRIQEKEGELSTKEAKAGIAKETAIIDKKLKAYRALLAKDPAVDRVSVAERGELKEYLTRFFILWRANERLTERDHIAELYPDDAKRREVLTKVRLAPLEDKANRATDPQLFDCLDGINTDEEFEDFLRWLAFHYGNRTLRLEIAEAERKLTADEEADLSDARAWKRAADEMLAYLEEESAADARRQKDESYEAEATAVAKSEGRAEVKAAMRGRGARCPADADPAPLSEARFIEVLEIASPEALKYAVGPPRGFFKSSERYAGGPPPEMAAPPSAALGTHERLIHAAAARYEVDEAARQKRAALGAEWAPLGLERRAPFRELFTMRLPKNLSGDYDVKVDAKLIGKAEEDVQDLYDAMEKLRIMAAGIATEILDHHGRITIRELARLNDCVADPRVLPLLLDYIADAISYALEAGPPGSDAASGTAARIAAELAAAFARKKLEGQGNIITLRQKVDIAALRLFEGGPAGESKTQREARLAAIAEDLAGGLNLVKHRPDLPGQAAGAPVEHGAALWGGSLPLGWFDAARRWYADTRGPDAKLSEAERTVLARELGEAAVNALYYPRALRAAAEATQRLVGNQSARDAENEQLEPLVRFLYENNSWRQIAPQLLDSDVASLGAAFQRIRLSPEVVERAGDLAQQAALSEANLKRLFPEWAAERAAAKKKGLAANRRQTDKKESAELRRLEKEEYRNLTKKRRAAMKITKADVLRRGEIEEKTLARREGKYMEGAAAEASEDEENEDDPVARAEAAAAEEDEGEEAQWGEDALAAADARVEIEREAALADARRARAEAAAAAVDARAANRDVEEVRAR